MIIRRYLFKEVITSFFAVLTVLLLIFIGNRLAHFLGLVVEGELPARMLLKMLAVIIFTSLDILLPLSLFIAVLIAFGRLYKDSEMTALSANGVSLADIYRALSLPVLLCVALSAAASFYITPLAVGLRFQIREQAKAEPELAAIQAGGFTQSADGRWVFYVEEITPDHQQMKNVFIQGAGKDGMDVYVAAAGHQHQDETSGDYFLILQDGYRYVGQPGQAAYQIFQYDEAAIKLEPRDVVPLTRDIDSGSTLQLWRSDKIENIAELQRRFSMPLGALLLSILGVLLSYTTPREGRYAKLFGAILIYILYNNLLGIAQSWLMQGKTSPLIGIWWVHALLIVFIVALVLRRYGLDWAWMVVSGRVTRRVTS
ncbi:MAG: LPS export ABC transporter permease LptF [Gammaproteobacteria bacterium RBG_16_57_12]|nr:MAG: LPS export ABC transporter permease LptF [Gammaproteobacteria bacterium RBG_16_57_12]